MIVARGSCQDRVAPVSVACNHFLERARKGDPGGFSRPEDLSMLKDPSSGGRRCLVCS
jgi:hypothetical protein